MSTGGTYGFRKGGVEKRTYCHSDGYPSWLGKKIVKFIRSTSIEEMNKIFDKIIIVSHSDSPTKEEIEEYWEYYDKDVNGGSLDTWYALLRETQGDLDVYKGFAKVMLECDWFESYNYTIDLDENKFIMNNLEFPLDSIPKNWVDRAEYD